MNRIKGITIWEQYAEFLVLGIAVLALIVFAAMQFIGEGNTVEVSGHGKVGPGTVDQRLIDEAQRLQGLLSPDSAPVVDIGTPKAILPSFERALASGVSPSSQLGKMHVAIPLMPGESIRAGEAFTEPEIAVPSQTVARQFFDTLVDGVVDEVEGLRSHFSSQPYDVTWITPASAIDVGRTLRSFKASGPDGLPAPIPTNWHGDQATILDVRIEREELVDGQWGGRIELDPNPGQFSYRRELAEGVDAPGRDTILRTAREIASQRDIAQPSFYATRNSSFIAPNPLEEAVVDSDDEDMRDLHQLRRYQRELDQLKEQLDELGGPLDDGDGGRPSGGGDGPGTPGGTPAPSGGAAGPSGASGQGAGDDPRQTEATRRNLMRRIAARERQIETLRARMPDVDAEPIDEDDDEMMIVWAHDLNVEPGRTYRYRVIVDFYNPFFARRLNLIEDQQHLADEIVISSQAAAWSEPITARPPLHPFVTRAYSPSQEPGSVSSSHSTGHAIVEVYRFYDGRWWQSQFNVEPGQRVGGPREEGGQVLIDYGTEWFVLDILEDADWEGREGRAARVMLQNINSGEILEVRHPRTDLDDPLRRRLSDEARAAGTS